MESITPGVVGREDSRVRKSGSFSQSKNSLMTGNLGTALWKVKCLNMNCNKYKESNIATVNFKLLHALFASNGG